MVEKSKKVLYRITYKKILKKQKVGGENMFKKDYDRSRTNQSDGQRFYGYDDKESKTTSWYSGNGTLDCVTDTPEDDEE